MASTGQMKSSRVYAQVIYIFVLANVTLVIYKLISSNTEFYLSLTSQHANVYKILILLIADCGVVERPLVRKSGISGYSWRGTLGFCNLMRAHAHNE